MSRVERAAVLPVSFFCRPAEAVAAELLGKVLVSRVGGVLTAGRIVETEAYLGVSDPASHAWQGRRHARNESLYGDAGRWYVYRSHGLHWCCNLVARGPDPAGAVLLRALEPLAGQEVMIERRGRADAKLLCAGPGRLAQALGITDALDGRPHGRRSGAWVVDDGGGSADHVACPRIGISRAVDWPLRFVAAGTRYASRPVPRQGR